MAAAAMVSDKANSFSLKKCAFFSQFPHLIKPKFIGLTEHWFTAELVEHLKPKKGLVYRSPTLLEY